MTPKWPDRLFIDNEWCAPASGKWMPVVDPATEEEIGRVPCADAGDVDRAARSAARAFEDGWGRTAPEERGALLNRVADLIDARKDEIALAETRDMGKPLRESYGNVARSSRTFRFYAGAVDKLAGEAPPVGPDGFNFTLHEPLGVTAHITPWNYPFANACRSVPPALAAGCTVVVKPASQTSVTTLMLGEICREAGLPAGVVNVVTGSGGETGAALARHPLVRGIAFTGSIDTGRRIMGYAAEGIRPVVLELGGKNPQIVFADCDRDKAIAQTMRGAFTNAGQVCTSVSRVLVERSLHDAYVEALAERIAALTVAPGLDNPDLGPLVSAGHLEQTAGFVGAGEREGARLLTGGRRPEGLDRGYFIRPALFDRVDPASTLAREEIFGPVLAVIPFDTEAEAVTIANGLEFGLTSGVFTRDIDRAMRVARDLKAGMVWVNEWFQSPVQVPHGGVKMSGIGREQGMVALANYTQVKDIAIRIGA
ncbi:MAG: aldehyde dehydrogenase [Rhodospirillaceae bacterium]|nr:aldehyde dehydrogenase [Rhodospirillaceae bacterium]